MERRRSGRGGWGRDLSIFMPQQAQSRGRGVGKAIGSCGTYIDTGLEVFSHPMLKRGSELVGLTGACLCCWRQLRTKTALRRK
jgi:hypothetical protein